MWTTGLYKLSPCEHSCCNNSSILKHNLPLWEPHHFAANWIAKSHYTHNTHFHQGPHPTLPSKCRSSNFLRFAFLGPAIAGPAKQPIKEPRPDPPPLPPPPPPPARPQYSTDRSNIGIYCVPWEEKCTFALQRPDEHVDIGLYDINCQKIGYYRGQNRDKVLLPFPIPHYVILRGKTSDPAFEYYGKWYDVKKGDGGIVHSSGIHVPGRNACLWSLIAFAIMIQMYRNDGSTRLRQIGWRRPG